MLITIPATALLFLQNKKIQTYLTHILTEELGRKLETRISVKNISVTFFNRFLIEDLYVEDHQGDTLLYSSKVKIIVRKFSNSKKIIDIKRLQFNNADFQLKNYGKHQNNLKFLIDKLKNEGEAGGEKFAFNIRRITFQDSRYRHFSPQNKPLKSPLNYYSMDLKEVGARIFDFEITGDTIQFQLSNIEFIENSGFMLRNLRAKLSINPEFLNFNNLYIETPNSEISASVLRFDFNEYKDFADFTEKVRLEINLRSSHLSFRDLAYFSNVFQGMNERVLMSGLLTGKINDISGERLMIAFGEYSGLKGSFNLIGLPDIRETFLHGDIESFQTHSRDLNKLHLPGKRIIELPEELSEIGAIRYQGKFTGYFDDFVTYGVLGSNLGQIATDLLITPDQEGNLLFKGSINTESLKIGELLSEQKLVGNLSMSANVDGSFSEKTVSANLIGIIDSLDVNGYTYKNINLKGYLSDKIFDGSFDITDPNIKLDFNGKVDFSRTIPVFDFTADVARLRPYYLNLDRSDPSYFASFLLKSNFSGIEPDHINGEIKLVNSFFQKSGQQLQIYDFTLASHNSHDSSNLVVRSDIFDADIYGKYLISSLRHSFRQMTAHFLPSLFPMAENHAQEDSISDFFDYNIHLKNINPVILFFAGNFEIGNNSYISGTYNSAIFESSFSGFFPEASFKSNRWTNINIIAQSDSVETRITGIADQLSFNEDLALENIVIDAGISNDTIVSLLAWENNSRPGYAGNIGLRAGLSQNDFTRNRQMYIQVEPSYFILNDTIWEIPSSGILLDSTAISIDSIMISTRSQQFLVDGLITNSKNDRLTITAENFDIETLNRFINRPELYIKGLATGTASLSDPYNSKLFISDIRISDLSVNNEFLGEGNIETIWKNREQKLFLTAGSQIDRSKIFAIEGDYTPSTRGIDFAIEINKFKIATLSPFTDDLVSDLKGLGFGNLKLEGSLEKPELNGKLEFFKASLLIDYLQTRYSFTDEVNIVDNNLYFSNFELFDQAGNSGRINGLITNNFFRDFNLNLRFESDQFSYLNTSSIDNELFYGKVVAGGLVAFTGPIDNLNMDITARSGKNTVFYIPLFGSEEVNETQFIEFYQNTQIDEKSTNGTEPYTKKVQGLTMNFNLEVTSDAEVQLIFDPKVGDILRARGNGDLSLSINSQGNFEIYGDMVIEEGDYLFTLQNIINKKFVVNPGSTIVWGGDPADATINLQALYTARTSIQPLATDLGPEDIEKLKKRIPVECRITLTDKLMNPAIKMDINLPTADQETQNILTNSISTEEEKTKQFLSLLVMNSFYTDPADGNYYTGNTSSTYKVATSELISNQLSNWLSQISNDVDVGFNYRPGDEITSDEVEIALRTQLLNGKLTLNGNVDVSTQNTEVSGQNPNTVVGDFDLDYKLTDNGKVHLKAFNKANDNTLFETSPYTQGVGISYREEFNTLGELFRRYKNAISRLFGKKENNEEGQAFRDQ